VRAAGFNLIPPPALAPGRQTHDRPRTGAGQSSLCSLRSSECRVT
jgi:hypothetical protein